MTADKNKMAANCWKHGSEAMLRENWDYAIEMFRQAAKFVPDNLMYRQSLRGVECRKYDENKTGAKMSTMKLMGTRASIKKARMKKNWEAIDLAAEDGLAINPWDAQLNADLGEACRHLEYTDVALFGYEKAVESDPENKDFLKALAELYSEKGRYSEASATWRRIQKIDPMDAEARRMAQQCLTMDVIETKGYEDAEDTKGVMTDKQISDRLGTGNQAADGPGMSLEADLQRAIRKEPENQDNYLKLGEHYRREGKLDEARAQFTKALEVSGGDADIREQIEDIDLDLLQQRVDNAKEIARNDADDEKALHNAKALAGELLKREISVFQSRVERYPNDLRVKFELGKRLMRIKKYAQAIPLFQQSSRDSRLAIEAMISLGKCFIAEKKGSLALRQFVKAIEAGIDPHDHPELFKEAHYWAARLYEDSGKQDDAESHYGEVLALDYEYKDARERLEGLQE